MMICRALCTSARNSTSLRVASPTTPAYPSAVAASMTLELGSTTTTCSFFSPVAQTVWIAERPFVPKPTTTVCSRKAALQRFSRHSSRVRSVRTSSVVPTRMIRNSTRSGVITKMLVNRAASLTGVMSPYPVVERVTVA